MNASPAPERSLLVFALGQEWYGFDLHQVRGVVPVGQLTPVPGVMAHIAGVQDLQGHLLAVLDMAGFLGLSAPPAREHVIVLSHEGVELGCLVDHAEDILVVGGEDWREPSATVRAQRPCVAAQAQLDGRLIGVLDTALIVREVSGA